MNITPLWDVTPRSLVDFTDASEERAASMISEEE